MVLLSVLGQWSFGSQSETKLTATFGYAALSRLLQIYGFLSGVLLLGEMEVACWMAVQPRLLSPQLRNLLPNNNQFDR